MNDAILTLQEVAVYLKVNKKTVYRMLEADQIPAFRVRSEWRFRKEAIDEWIAYFDIPVLGRIAAGTPILAEENIEGTVKVDKKRLRNPDGVFALKVHGDSMINAGINDYDIVLIRVQPDVDNGQIGAVIIDGETTLKRVYKKDGKIILKPENDTMEPIIVEPENKDIRIAGKMLMVMKQEQKRSDAAIRSVPHPKASGRPESTAGNLTKDEIFRQIRSYQDVLEKHKVKRIGLFGSYARGEQTSASDIDFVVDFDLSKFGENFKGLYGALCDLSDYLENLFKKKVEILTPVSIEDIRIKEVKDEIQRSIIYA